MTTSSKTNSDKEQKLWVRALYMLIFALAFGISESILYLLAIVSLIYRAINGKNHQTMVGFGHSLAQYIHQLADYMTFNTEQTPFPFGDWPGSHKPITEDSKPVTED